jgi:hypothetical protein
MINSTKRSTTSVLVGIGVGMLALAVVTWAVCPDVTASYTDRTQACNDCTSNNYSPAGTPCTWHSTDVTGYCDCLKKYKCEKTGTTYPNKIVTTHTGTCPGAPYAGNCSDNSQTSAAGTVTEYYGTLCTTGD